MNRTITVKGTGKLSVKPDYTVISLSLHSVNKVYAKAMEKASESIEALRGALEAVGFDRETLKTTYFNVGTEYGSRRDKNGNYQQYFVGYAVNQGLSLEFDFDTARLADTLGAIAACVAEPQLNIAFTVKDKDAVSTALLEAACANAREKAKTLARASKVKLGDLLTVDYNWGNPDLTSPTRFDMGNGIMAKACCDAEEINIAPDDIKVSDNVTFVWEIKD